MKFVFKFTAAIIVLVLLVQFAAAEDWPMFRHDLEHTGETSDVIENPENLGVKWKFKTGDSLRSSPAVSGNYVYVGSWDGHIYCLDKNTGDIEWKFKTGNKVTSSPIISGNYVYVGSEDSYVYCLDKNTGELIWKYKAGDGVYSSPAISGNYVYVGSDDNYVYCLDKNTGKEKWNFKTENWVRSSPAISGDYVYVGSSDGDHLNGYVYCLDKNTGELIRKFGTGQIMYSSPAISGDYIYVGSLGKGPRAYYDHSIYCFNKNTGELKWKYNTGNYVESSPAISGDYVYVGSIDGYVYCLDKNSGELKWKYKKGGIVYSSPAVSGNYVYVGSGDYSFYCLNKNSGELKWNFETGDVVHSSPAVSGNYVYVGSYDGYVYAFAVPGRFDMITDNIDSKYIIGFIIFLIISTLVYYFVIKRGKTKQETTTTSTQRQQQTPEFNLNYEQPKTTPSTTSPKIILNNIKKSYQSTEILKSISLEFEDGKIYGIVGPSGCGKSRLIESIIGRVSPDSGSISVFGVDSKDKKKVNEIVGFVPQHPELYTEQTVMQNMQNSAIKWGIGVREFEGAEKILRDVELHDRKDVSAKNLSGGQVKRLSLAMELLRNPQVLLLDEPTTGLDPTMRMKIMGIFEKLNRTEGKLIIFTTHYMDEIDICDEVVIMKAGEVLVKAGLDELRRRTPGRGRIVEVTLYSPIAGIAEKLESDNKIEKVIESGRILHIFTHEPNVMEIGNKISSLGGVVEGSRMTTADMRDLFIYYTDELPEDE